MISPDSEADGRLSTPIRKYRDVPSGRADTLVRAGRLRPAQVGQGADCGPEGPPYQSGPSAKFVIVFANGSTKDAEAEKSVPKADHYIKLTAIKMISTTCP